jgi:hypothetical protein
MNCVESGPIADLSSRIDVISKATPLLYWYTEKKRLKNWVDIS